jgi:hypothetical protein
VSLKLPKDKADKNRANQFDTDYLCGENWEKDDG